MSNDPTPTVEQVEVTQEDRSLAGDWLGSIDGGGTSWLVAKVWSGAKDDHPLVQAFARHRLATTPNTADYAAGQRSTTRSGGEGVREALRRMVYETTHLSPCKPNGDHDCTIKADTLAYARRALSTASPQHTSSDDAGLVERIRAAVTYVYMPMQVRKLLSEAAAALATTPSPEAKSDGAGVDANGGILAVLRDLRRAVEETGIHRKESAVAQAMAQATIVLGRGY